MIGETCGRLVRMSLQRRMSLSFEGKQRNGEQRSDQKERWSCVVASDDMNYMSS